jgi:manganese/zinc/iron transport system ATP- binding protein
MQMEPLVQFKNVTLAYGKKIVLREVDFTIYQEDFFGLVGPNGAGKTTLLRAILGTLRPLSGEITLTRPSLGPVRFGYVPQRDTVDYIMPYTVSEVAMMGRYRQMGLFRSAGKEDHDAVQNSLRHVDIEELRDLPFKNLSGGQKQRVLIARALASEPAVLVLDEPTNGMDLSSRKSILDLIQRLHSEGDLTIVMVSHLLDDVANYVGRIAIVEREYFQVGEVSQVLTAENLSILYRMPVHVMHVGGNKVILAGESHGQP